MEKLNILMVDDQPGKLLTYEAMLSQLGENLIKAATAREALAYLLRDDVAVVLMDVNMPELDGFELAELIRQHPRCDKTAIIFVSAVHLSDLDRVRGYETGAVDYVSVPVVPEILRAKIGVFLDLYRKTSELERLNHTLEERVAARTAELEKSVLQLQDSERRLRLQGEALADADRRKNEFLAMLAHELRNPLQPIRSAVELLGTASSRQDWAREVIGRQVNQLVRLVDDLLDASRISSGKLALRKEVVEVAQIVAASVEANKPFAEQKRHELIVHNPPHPVRVTGDSLRLAQVFTNLLNNAVKFTPPGGRVTISAEQQNRDLVVRVGDNGNGIAAEDLVRVFDIFYQAKSTAEQGNSGLGLGLALVRQLVHLHGGSVEAHSAGIGEGSEFIVRLPVLMDLSTLEETAIAKTSEPTFAMGRRILVVDDNRDAAESLALMLRMSGNEVDIAFDGSHALRASAQFQPDVILLDIGMPKLDGYQVARLIRKRPRGGDVILIAITGWGGDGDRKRSQEAGFDRHLVKPVLPSEVLSLLASLER